MVGTTKLLPAVLAISVEHADNLEDKLYKIEKISVTMQAVLDSDIDEPDFVVCAISALRKELHRSLQGCISDLEKAGVLSAARRSTA